MYYTRLELRWLRGLLPELHLGVANAVFVGGDFLLPPHVDDQTALHPSRLQRWGPQAPTPYHVLVQPRPHLDS